MRGKPRRNGIISPWLNTTDAAIHCRCGRNVIHEALASGELLGCTAGGRGTVWFHVDDLDDWMRSHPAYVPDKNKTRRYRREVYHVDWKDIK